MMYSKLKITAELTVVTGLHIGAGGGFSAIGAVDSPVIRDPYSGYPMIPGSSLKGKMRTLLAKSALPPDTYVLKGCESDPEEISRLFGTPNGKDGNPHTARLQFSDLFLQNAAALLAHGGITEDKAENFITRTTSIANPRHIERVVRGAKFGAVWFYTAEKADEIKADMQTLAKACRLLEMDYLGGSGTRGYGRVALDQFSFEALGDAFPVSTEEIAEIFKDVSAYAAKSL